MANEGKRKGYEVRIEFLQRKNDYVPMEVHCVLATGIAEILGSIAFREDLNRIREIHVREIGLAKDTAGTEISSTITPAAS